MNRIFLFKAVVGVNWLMRQVNRLMVTKLTRLLIQVDQPAIRMLLVVMAKLMGTDDQIQSISITIEKLERAIDEKLLHDNNWMVQWLWCISWLIRHSITNSQEQNEVERRLIKGDPEGDLKINVPKHKAKYSEPNRRLLLLTLVLSIVIIRACKSFLHLWKLLKKKAWWAFSSNLLKHHRLWNRNECSKHVKLNC